MGAFQDAITEIAIEQGIDNDHTRAYLALGKQAKLTPEEYEQAVSYLLGRNLSPAEKKYCLHRQRHGATVDSAANFLRMHARLNIALNIRP